ncbi:RNA polymerase recycling motor HelD [Cytobacillus sp. IB215665]|uniref:RNA polymerase recycling motor HelD n=1 Tax=Cytobacillus sp. IB215665 TaxID=3097357 RepID=UPI002A11B109|nr:RNA polymerase recycling motor HelD [Cytobacillus sp. IB215665]MDX8366169.1 RNA polymerase recycling motor HelD [Cytobacillus sp. IB215665]
MNKVSKEWHGEQHRVDFVVEKISTELGSLNKDIGDVKAEIINIRKHFWDDVTVNLDNTNEATETAISVKQQAEMLSERERNHKQAFQQITTLNKLKDSPYFGRVDFVEDGECEKENIYIGIRSYYDEESEQFLVYDWRAPISSLYYDYSLGRAQFLTPEGVISGEMNLKRQFIVHESQIVSMFDTGVTIGDKLLQEVLGNQSSSQMKSIVATIQKEQNLIIRNESSRLLIVQGAAGSGKTSAALQRVAFLLYRYRETLQAEQILLFSPNSMFNSYVSTVLPELGEDNMQQTTLQEYIDHQLGEEFDLEDQYEQLEYTLTANKDSRYSVRMNNIRYKASMDFMLLIDHYINQLKKRDMIFKDISFRNKVVISADQINEQFYSFNTSMRIPNRLTLMVEWLLKELKKIEKAERKKSWVEDEIELLDRDVYARVYRKLQRDNNKYNNTFDDYRREQKLLAAIVVRKHFKPLLAIVEHLRFVDVRKIYMQLFTTKQFMNMPKAEENIHYQWGEMCDQTVARIEKFELAFEDTIPYLYLKEQLEGFKKNTAVKHIFIDEAQDYSPFQFAYINYLFPNSKMTILGDKNQTIHYQASQDGFASLTKMIGENQTECIDLTRSYRSTRPIIEFTKEILVGNVAIDAFNREGDKPFMTKVDNDKIHVDKVKQRIHKLQLEGHKTIAVICKTADESRKAYDRLKNDITLRLINKTTNSFESGVLVIPSYLAKGVEFDAVIIFNGSSSIYLDENERKLFYTACTRAMHKLHIFFIGEMSPFLSCISPSKYIIEHSH